MKIQENINSKKITKEIFNTYIIINLISRISSLNIFDKDFPVEIFDDNKKSIEIYEILLKNLKVKNYTLKLIKSNNEILHHSVSGSFYGYESLNFSKKSKKKRKILTSRKVESSNRDDLVNMRFEPILNQANVSIQTILDNL